VTPLEELLAQRVARLHAVATRAADPAMLVYTSGTTGPPKGALMPHRACSATCRDSSTRTTAIPQPGDLFWSPADWAWTGGLMDALLPTLYFGQPIVGYRGRFDPERALRADRAKYASATRSCSRPRSR
jgi:acetyl-CoA synthetase